MRIVSWNINGASGSWRASDEQLERSWHHLASLAPDIALIQEARPSSIPSWVHDRWTIVKGERGVLTKDGEWGSLIAARPEFRLQFRDDLTVPGSLIGAAYDYLVVGEIHVGSISFLVASVHAIANSAEHMVEMTRQADAIDLSSLQHLRIEPDDLWSTDVIFEGLRAAAEGRGQRFVIGGDWNTSRLFDKNNPTRVQPTNALFFSRAWAAGWYEAFGGQNEQQTFFRNKARPLQLDHVFLDRRTHEMLRTAEVWLTPEALALSDHAPIVIDLDDSDAA